MELKPFYHEAQIALSDDFTLHLVIDVTAVEVLERLLGRSIDVIVGDMLSSISVLTKVLWGVTREYHPDLSLDQVAGILLTGDPKKQALGDAVVTTLGDLLVRALLVAPDKKPPMQKRKRAKVSQHG